MRLSLSPTLAIIEVTVSGKATRSLLCHHIAKLQLAIRIDIRIDMATALARHGDSTGTEASNEPLLCRCVGRTRWPRCVSALASSPPLVASTAGDCIHYPPGVDPSQESSKPVKGTHKKKAHVTGEWCYQSVHRYLFRILRQDVDQHTL